MPETYCYPVLNILHTAGADTGFVTDTDSDCHID